MPKSDDNLKVKKDKKSKKDKKKDKKSKKDKKKQHIPVGINLKQTFNIGSIGNKEKTKKKSRTKSIKKDKIDKKKVDMKGGFSLGGGGGSASIGQGAGITNTEASLLRNAVPYDSADRLERKLDDIKRAPADDSKTTAMVLTERNRLTDIDMENTNQIRELYKNIDYLNEIVRIKSLPYSSSK